ncbi:MAG: hypothetical protein SFZ03_02340 [Candidatus Melainabacteria bacterium]|nr:hypothetical protein [Candidatus Melainabacteria bacterium]
MAGFIPGTSTAPIQSSAPYIPVVGSPGSTDPLSLGRQMAANQQLESVVSTNPAQIQSLTDMVLATELGTGFTSGAPIGLGAPGGSIFPPGIASTPQLVSAAPTQPPRPLTPDQFLSLLADNPEQANAYLEAAPPELRERFLNSFTDAQKERLNELSGDSRQANQGGNEANDGGGGGGDTLKTIAGIAGTVAQVAGLFGG